MSDRVYQQLRGHLAYLKLSAAAEQLAVHLRWRAEDEAQLHEVPG